MRKVHNMRGATFIYMLKIDCFARQNDVLGCCLLLHANSWLYAEYFTTAAYFYKTSTSAIENNPILSIRYQVLKLAFQCMEMLNKRK